MARHKKKKKPNPFKDLDAGLIPDDKVPAFIRSRFHSQAIAEEAIKFHWFWQKIQANKPDPHNSKNSNRSRSILELFS